MAMSNGLRDREYKKFKETNDDSTAVSTAIGVQKTTLVKTFTAATSGVAFYSDSVVNGQIVQVEQSSFWQNGSLSLTPSGTGSYGVTTAQEIWHKNASSGTASAIYYPAHFTESTTGSIAGAEHVQFYVDDVLKITTGSTASGTSQTLGVIVKYI